VKPRPAVMLLAALVVVDLVLVAVAWQRAHTRSTEEPIDFAQEQADREVPDESGVVESGTATAPPKRYVAAVAEHGLLVRAPRASCASGPEPLTVETSDDSGRTFTTFTLDDVTSTLWLDARSDSSAVLVGTDAACDVVEFSTSDAGESWTRTGSPDPGWLRLPQGRRLRSPAGNVAVSCRPQVVSPVDPEVARVLCQDGKILGTSDTGSSWVNLGRLESGLALDFVSTSTAHALSRQPDCASAVLRTEDGGTTWVRELCAAGRPRALAADASTVVVMTDQAVVVSTDGGTTWTAR